MNFFQGRIIQQQYQIDNNQKIQELLHYLLNEIQLLESEKSSLMHFLPKEDTVLEEDLPKEKGELNPYYSFYHLYFLRIKPI